MKKIELLRYIILGAVATLVATFMLPKKENRKGHPRDYAEMATSGAPRVATEYNPISFCVDGDTLSGLRYRLIEAFVRNHNLQVAIAPKMGFNEWLEGLAEGRYDVIAYGLLAASELGDSLLLTAPVVLNRQVSVQCKVDSLGDSLFIRSQLDLAGKALNVVKDSPSTLRIHNLGNKVGDTIYTSEIEKYGSEQLIALVAHDDIDYAVCDGAIARSAVDNLPQMDTNTATSFIQFYSRGVGKRSPVFLDNLNSWLERFRTKREYKKIYKKHYK